MSAKEITNQAKATCARREASMRRRVYQRWVDEGRLGWSQERADKEIATMEAIAADYEAKVKEEAAQISPTLL